MKDKEPGRIGHNLDVVQGQGQLLDQLTLEIIDQMEKGQQINFADYARRYPQLANELKANLANYWLEDREVIRQTEEERHSPEYLARLASELSDSQQQNRLNKTLDKIMANTTSAVTDIGSTLGQAKANETTIEGLYKLGAIKGIKPPELARQVGLSSDIMMKLDRKAFRLASLPTELLNRLAKVLEVSLGQLSLYLGGSQLAASAQHFNLDKPEAARQQDFAQAVRESEGLNPQQKAFWLQETETHPFKPSTNNHEQD